MSSDILSSPAPSVSESENDSDIWEEKYNNLHADYQKLEARVVALGQQEYQITDDKITKKYRQIRDGLDIWIDGLQEEDRKEFRLIYQTNLQRRDRKKLFKDLDFKGDCLDERWEEELGRQETCIYVVLGMAIATFLKEFFAEPYPVGVRRAQKDFLDRLMKSSTHIKEQAKLYRWRGETLSMIVSTSEFTKRCSQESDLLFQSLKSAIWAWLSPKSLSKHESALRDLVLRPAVDFHRMINCSGKKFETQSWSAIQNSVPEIAASWDIIDIVSWRVSRKSDIKGVFHCLFPALVMRAALDQSEVTFVSPVLLGYTISGLDPSKIARSSPLPPIRQEPAVTERGIPGPQNSSGIRHSQSQISRGSTSKEQKPEPTVSKDHNTESSTSKDHKSETSFSGWRTMLLGNRSENRQDGVLNRKGSHPTRSLSPNKSSVRQDPKPVSRQVPAIPSNHATTSDHPLVTDQYKISDQSLASSSQASTTFTTTEGIAVVTVESVHTTGDHDRHLSHSVIYDLDSSKETQIGTRVGFVNNLPEYAATYATEEENRRSAGLPPLQPGGRE